MGIEAISEPADLEPSDAQFRDISDASLEEAAGRRFSAEIPPPPEQEPEEPPEEPQEPSPEPDTGEPAPEPEAAPEAPQAATVDPYRFEDLGVTVDPTLARQYALFEHRLRTDPSFLAAVQGALGVGAQSPAPAAPAPPTTAAPLGPPPELDLDDPGTKWFVEQVGELKGQLDAARQIAEAHQAYIAGQQNQATQAMVESAVSTFREQKGLSDEDMAEIRQVAGSRVQIDPGAAQADPHGAVTGALEIAYWSIPRFREAMLNQNQAQAVEDRKRQRKLAAVTGSSGAAPRVAPEPRTAAERKEALADAVRAAWAGNDV